MAERSWTGFRRLSRAGAAFFFLFFFCDEMSGMCFFFFFLFLEFLESFVVAPNPRNRGFKLFL